MFILGRCIFASISVTLYCTLAHSVDGQLPLIPFTENTTQLVASCSKVAESLTVALMVDRGLLSYEDSIAEHWPEFAAHGKEHITVRQLMMHQAGLAAPGNMITPEYLLDADKLSALLASQSTNWRVPKVSGDAWRTSPAQQAYHMVTRGLFAGALVRRVDPQHRSLGTVFREDIATPLGLDFYLGNVPTSVMVGVRMC
jgi:CubicO group peptidase (beta-lactamase class C family)